MAKGKNFFHIVDKMKKNRQNATNRKNDPHQHSALIFKGNKSVNVFLPTTPNPTSGFMLFVPEKDLIRLSMNIEEGIKRSVNWFVENYDKCRK